MPSGGSKNQNYLPTGKFTDLLARRCASIFELRSSKTKSILTKCSILDFISKTMAPYLPIPSPWMLRTTLAQSLASLAAYKPRSLARATPSRQAIASTTSASVFPSTTSAEAPKKLPPTSRVTVADAECLKFLETAASMLILASPAGVLIHRGGRTPELSLVEPVSSLAGLL